MQAALSSLEKEAKENVYAVLDPHIQYEITINKHGEPPKYLSLSKPLTHQRAHAETITNEVNNNNHYDRFTTFKTGPPKARRSNRSQRNDHKSYICKTNNDIEYSMDPNFGIPRDREAEVENEYRSSKNYSRMYERNNSGRKDNTKKDNQEIYGRQDAKRMSNRNREDFYKKTAREIEKERSFEEFDADVQKPDGDEDFRPRPGKVREIASRFNRNSSNSQSGKKERPKPLQSFGNQAYLDHIFPDAVEV